MSQSVRTNTEEELFVTMAANRKDNDFPKMIQHGRDILSGKIQTKWMSIQSSVEYSAVVADQLPRISSIIAKDPDSRQLVLHGPTGACWVSSQLISTSPGNYTLISHYRSMDADHLESDMAIQTYIAESVLEETPYNLTEVKAVITSYHVYK